MKKLTGSIVALVTPFHEDGSVDFARLRELCDWHIANGTDAILALGTTGETASTSLEEDIKTLECVIDHVNGRVPVIAGAGSNCRSTRASSIPRWARLRCCASAPIMSRRMKRACTATS